MIISQLRLNRFQLDARLLIIGSGIIAVSFFGVQNLLKSLYLLRMGYDLSYIGIFSAAGSLTYMVMSLLSGVIASRFGNRSVMLLGGIVTTLGMALLPLAEFVPTSLHYWFPLFTQFVVSAGWAFYNISFVPALMTSASAENRNTAFALSSTFRGLGTFVGTLIGGMLPGFFAFLLNQPVDQPAPYRYALLVGAALGLVALVPILRMESSDTTVQQSSASPEIESAFPFLGMVLLILHVYFGNSSAALCQVFCNAYMDRELHFSTAFIGLLTGIGQFVAIVSPLIAPRLAQRWGNAWILMMTTCGTALSLLPLIYIHNWFGAGIGSLGTLTLSAMWMPALQVYQMEMVSKRWRTIAYGVLSMGMSFTFTSVSLAGGYIATHWGYQSLFLLGVGASLIGSLLMAGMRRVPRLMATHGG